MDTQSKHPWAHRIATVLVTYNRPSHTAEVVRALRDAAIQNLIILSDAPRIAEHLQGVEETRRIIAAIDWTTPQVICQEHNQGLARSVVQGVNLALERFEAVILLEDDCVPQAFFFPFMYECLSRYEHKQSVFGVSGYSTTLPGEFRVQYPYDLYFHPRMGSWGWATWRNRWRLDNRNLAQLTIQAIEQGIDLEQGGGDVRNAIGQVLLGKIKDTWTLPWLLNVYIHKGCYIYPTVSHIKNIGLDGSGVHCGRTDKYNTETATIGPSRFPAEPFFESAVSEMFQAYQAAPYRLFSNEQLLEIAKIRGLKVVHICTYDHGGAGVAALRLHQGLRAAGALSSMLVLSKRSQDPDVHVVGDLRESSLRRHKIMTEHPNWRRDLELFSDPLSTLDLAQHDIFRNADVVNLHWVSGIVDHSRLAQMLGGKPAVWTLHDMNAFTGGCHYNCECRKFTEQCGACPQLGSTKEQDISNQGVESKRQGYTNANLHIVAPSKWMAAEAQASSLLRAFPVSVIPNGFPVDTFRPFSPAIIRNHLGIPMERKVVLFGCSSLGDIRKGFVHLLAALELLSQRTQEPPLFCFFGAQQEGLQLPVNCISLGKIEDPELLSAVYAMADVFVISSLQDNLPNVVPESLASGTPVVGFRIGGIPDMIEHERTGYLVEPYHIGALADGIQWVLNHANPSMRAACRQAAETRYAQAVQSANYLHLYRQILSTGAARPNALAPAALTPPVLVNLGCGSRFHPAWENFDFASRHPSVKIANLLHGIPLPENHADAVYHSHMLEHLPKSQAAGFIKECHRVLRPGGLLRIAVPDLETITRLYLENLDKAAGGDANAELKYDWMTLELLDQMVRNRPGGAMLEWWVAPELKGREFIVARQGDEINRVLDAIRQGACPPTYADPTDPTVLGHFRLSGEIHQWMYDRVSLARLLKQQGFVAIRQVSATESAIPNFSSYLLDTNEQGLTRKPDSLFMEAHKR